MPKRSITLIITDLDDGTHARTSLRQFCRANPSQGPGTEDVCRRAMRLKPGHSFTGGGGAAPWFKVTRARGA